MTRIDMAGLGLRARLLLGRIGPVGIASVVLLFACAGALAWLAQATDLLERRQQLAERMAVLPKPAPKAAPAPANDNMVLFYRSLGERRHAGEQVRTLFAIASKAGLVLSKGEYREVFDPNARVWSYQVTLPVKGSYSAIWDFALQSLQAIPFASLDDIGFHRDTVGDPTVEARLRFTLYLGEPAQGEGR